MAIGDGMYRLGADIPVSKIPKPAPSLTPRARTPPRTQTSTAPSRIPQANSASKCRRHHSLEAPSAHSNGQVSQRSLTPPPSSNPRDGEMVRLKMRCAERLQRKLQDQNVRADHSPEKERRSQPTVCTTAEYAAEANSNPTSRLASEIPMLKQRVEPGRTMTTPPRLSKTKAPSPPSMAARRSSAPTSISAAAKTDATTSQRTSPDVGSQGLRRTRSAGIIPVRNSTPRSSHVPPKPIDSRSLGSTTQTRRPATSTCALVRRKTPPPSNNFSPPVRRTSLGKASVKASSSDGFAKAMTKEDSAPVLEQILQENRELRAAFNFATDRIAALEDGQNRFFNEDIFDLVNAAHSGPTPMPPPMADTEHLQTVFAQPATSVERPQAPSDRGWWSDSDQPALVY